jgi:hypothetical protein
MALDINVAGACLIKVGTGSGGSLESLGYTRDGAQVTNEAYKVGVKTDDNGGENGPDTDVQNLGETVRIRIELTKWDEAIADKIRCRESGGTAGTVPTPGTLQIAGGKAFRLLLHSATRPLNFPICMFLEPIEINKGTKYSTLVIEAVAYKAIATGVLYNNTTT